MALRSLSNAMAELANVCGGLTRRSELHLYSLLSAVRALERAERGCAELSAAGGLLSTLSRALAPTPTAYLLRRPQTQE